MLPRGVEFGLALSLLTPRELIVTWGRRHSAGEHPDSAGVDAAGAPAVGPIPLAFAEVQPVSQLICPRPKGALYLSPGQA